jgi:hypothetical protein
MGNSIKTKYPNECVITNSGLHLYEKSIPGFRCLYCHLHIAKIKDKLILNTIKFIEMVLKRS